MYDSSTGHAVRVSLEAIAKSAREPSTEARDALRDLVFAAVDELTALGWPIEQIIVRMKELTMEVGLPSRASALQPNRDEVIADVVRWCIDRHYLRLDQRDGG